MNISVQEILDISERGVNTMVKEVQDKIGVTTGDVAGQFFSGDELKHAIATALIAYVSTERNMMHETK